MAAIAGNRPAAGRLGRLVWMIALLAAGCLPRHFADREAGKPAGPPTVPAGRGNTAPEQLDPAIDRKSVV